MTTDRMALLELIEKRADGDLVRELLGYAAERLMAVAVEGLCGAGHGERGSARLAPTGATAIASGRERRSRRDTRAVDDRPGPGPSAGCCRPQRR